MREGTANEVAVNMGTVQGRTNQAGTVSLPLLFGVPHVTFTIATNRSKGNAIRMYKKSSTYFCITHFFNNLSQIRHCLAHMF